MKKYLITHFITCGCIELTGALISMVHGNWVAGWILLGCTAITALLGFILYKKED